MQTNEISAVEVEGAPAAPKKMHQAASAVAPTDWAAAYPQQPPHAYNGFPPQALEYSSYASSASSGSSRYQPYTRYTSAAQATPTHPSSYRSSQPPPPPAIRAAPRPTYLEQAKQPSRELSEQEALDRKLLVVLDLNGTLVFRGKSGSGRAIDSTRAVPRPYLYCFLQYCLGRSSSNAPNGKQVSIASRPHGSHFWQLTPATDTLLAKVHEPRSAGKAEVVVWSSAQPMNVDSMVRASFDESVRSQILRVWARDTLVPQRFYQSKAESIKDLEIVWAELNAFVHDQPLPGRLMAQARDAADQLRPDDAPPPTVPTAPAADKKYRGKKHKQKLREQKQQQQQQQRMQQEQPKSAALEAALKAEELGPWCAANTVLVDDSVSKARLQPYNHLLIPEFDKVEAGRMKKFIRQQVEGDETEAELEWDSDLSVDEAETKNETAAIDAAQMATDKVASNEVTDDAKATRVDAQPDTQEAASSEPVQTKKKPMPESRLDDVLLQTIGVLETLRHQSNVSAFICAGGIKGYGQPKAPPQLSHTDPAQPGTPEYWAHQGRLVCAKLGIEVKAWVPGKAASATAALL